MLLSVFNEERVIREKIENFLQLDYPEHSLELIVVSDGCTDRTEDLVRAFDLDRVRLFIQERRGGKTLALNRAAQEAKGDILVFTDANSMYDPAAVRKLARHFADSEVGLVSGRSIYLDDQNRQEQSGGVYRRYEDFIKDQESATVSIIGADGAIYAMRRELYVPLPAEYINDFIHPLQVVCKRLRAVQEPDAVCWESQDADTKNELQRQTRIMAQSWLIVFTQVKGLLAAGCVGYFWALMSHKVLRWLSLPLMGALLATNLWLAGHGAFFQALLLGQIGFYLLIPLGRQSDQKLLHIPALFFLIHVTALIGLLKLAIGNKYTIWNPRKY